MKSMKGATMQKSKKSLYVAVVGFLLAVILLGVLLLRDYAQLMSGAEFERLLRSNDAPQEVFVDSNYFYFTQDSQAYKVFREGVSEARIKQLKVRQKHGYFALFVLVAVGLCAAFGLWWFGGRKRAMAESFSISNGAVGQSGGKQGGGKQGVSNQNGGADGTLGLAPMHSSVRLADVAGISAAKEELFELIDVLQNPQKYRELGISMPKGVLLVGPPGVGKTLIAKAMAGEAGVPFFYQSGAGFVQIYAGMGAKRVRELFSVARSHAPALVFIDEIDALGKARGGNRSDERESTLNELLMQMDGFDESSGVVVIAATNKIEVLDEALLRSGRFDRKVFLELPSLQEREEILRVHLRSKDFSFDIAEVARKCVGFSGAAIASLVNEAALFALKNHQKTLTLESILAVKDKVFLGKKALLGLDEGQKELLSIYQAAKGVSGVLLGLEFEKCPLLGELVILEEQSIRSQESLRARIRFALSGTLALKLVKNQGFTLGEKDLQEAKNIAKEMLEYEMISCAQSELEELRSLQMEALTLHLEAVKRVAQALLEQEGLNYEELKNLL